MNQRISLLATTFLFLAGIVCSASPSAEASGKPKLPPLKALAGQNFYDFFAGMSPDSEGAVAWYAGLAAGVEQTDGPIKALLESRLAILVAKGGAAVEQWKEDARALEDRSDQSSGDVAENREPPDPLSVPTNCDIEIQLLMQAANAIVQPGAIPWDEAFTKTLGVSTDWQPKFSAFAYLLAADHAIASGRVLRALEHSVWSRVHADASDRTVLRRAARERILTALAKLDRLDSELAQQAALQVADRERLGLPVRQIALDVLQAEMGANIDSVRTLARKIAFAGPEQRIAGDRQIRTRPYLLAALHTLSAPGPIAGARKRLSLLEEAIELAESHDSELAARLKVPYLSALLRAQRFNSVVQQAESTFEAMEGRKLRSLGIEASIIASIAAAHARKLDLHDEWRQVVRQGIEQLASQPAEVPSTLAPRNVLHELLTSKAAKKAGRSDARSLANLDRTVEPTRSDAKATKLASRLADKQQRRSSRWNLLFFTCAAVLGCLGLFLLVALRWPRREPIIIDATPQPPAPVALLGPPSAIPTIETGQLSGGQTSEATVGSSGESSASKLFGTKDFQLGQLLRDSIADLQRRDRTSKFELASDSGGDYDQTIVADYSKLRRLLRHLGVATSRFAEGRRIMVGGMLRDDSTDAVITLELSFIYPLPAVSEDTTTGTLGDCWAEDNVLASLVHLLSCNVSHQQEDNLGCLVASLPLSAVHSSDHTSGNYSLPKNQGVLVVDADPLVLKSLSASLQALGCDCTCGSSLEEARELLAHPRNYSIVMLDINLPKDDSLLISQEIKRMPPSIRPTVIAMGNAADTAVGSRATFDSFDDVLVKPYTLQRLAFVVQSARAD